MDLNPVDIEETLREGVQRKCKPPRKEVDEAHMLTIAGQRYYLFARRTSLKLLQWWEEPFLLKIFEILRLDGGLGSVAVHLLQAHIVTWIYITGTLP